MFQPWLYLKANYDENDLRGCVDHFLKAQREEVDENGRPLLDDDCLTGIILDIYGAGGWASFNNHK